MMNFSTILDRVFQPEPEIPEHAYNGYGFIEAGPKNDDWMLGGPVQAKKEILSRGREYMGYLPAREWQKKTFDSYSCVIFSMLNNVEIVFKYKFGLDVNFSDRYLAALTPVVPFRGTTFSAACDALRAYGSVLEENYPWTDDIDTVEKYFALPSQSLIDQGRALLNTYDIQHEWVDYGGCNPELLYEALIYGPVQASVNAAATWTGRRIVGQTDHAISIVKAVWKQSFTILDHYSRETYDVPWNFYFGSAKQFSVLRKQKKQLVMIYDVETAEERAKIYAINGTVANHIANYHSWKYGGTIGEWQGPGGQVTVIPQATFNKRFTIGEAVSYS